MLKMISPMHLAAPPFGTQLCPCPVMPCIDVVHTHTHTPLSKFSLEIDTDPSSDLSCFYQSYGQITAKRKGLKSRV